MPAKIHWVIQLYLTGVLKTLDFVWDWVEITLSLLSLPDFLAKKSNGNPPAPIEFAQNAPKEIDSDKHSKNEPAEPLEILKQKSATNVNINNNQHYH